MGKRVNQLRSKPAIIGWVTIAVFVWKIIEALDTLKGVVENINTVWNFLSTPIGMLVLLLVGLGLIAYSVFRKEHKKVEENKTELMLTQKETLSWLEQELSSDLKRVYEGMRGKVTQWDFSNIHKRERSFDIIIELTNTTIFTFHLKGVSEFMKIADEKCSNSPHTSPHFNIRRDEPAIIRLTQSITSETAKLIQKFGNDNKELKFDLGEVKFEIENTTEGYERYKPNMTGGVYDIVPKDRLKIEDKIEIEVRKHLVRKNKKQGYFEIDIEFTLNVSKLPIQLEKAQLCIADEIIDPVSISPIIPRILGANVESYTVRYEPTDHQFLKSRLITADRQRELNLMLSKSRWTREECKAYLRLTIGGNEKDFQKFIFDFESSRSQ